MRIGIIGWWHHNAVADDLILESAKCGLRSVCDDITFIDMLEFYKTNIVEHLNFLDLIVIGGGTLLGEMALYPLSTIDNWHDKVKTPIIILGGAFRNTQASKLPENINKTKLLFGASKSSGARGPISQKHFENIGIECPISGDTGFLMECEKDEKMGDTVGMVVRNVPNQTLHYGTNEGIWDFFAKAADYIIEEHNKRVVFIPFRDMYPIVDNDRWASQQVINRMKHSSKASIVVPPYYDPISTLKSLSRMDFLVSERLHPTIFSYMFGVPTIPIEIQFDKIMDVGKTMGIEDYVMRGDQLDLDKFKMNFTSLINNQQFMKEVKSNILDHKQKLLEICKKGIELGEEYAGK